MLRKKALTPEATLTPPVGKRDHVQGLPTALVTLVEYGDCQCPYCYDARPIIKKLQKHFDGQLRYVFRHFPLVKMHKYAERGAEAMEAAGNQEKFWEMLDYLFDHQEELDAAQVMQAATFLRLDKVKFSREVAERIHRGRVQKDVQSGIRSGVSGTPALFINGVLARDADDFKSLKAKVDEAILLREKSEMGRKSTKRSK